MSSGRLNNTRTTARSDDVPAILFDLDGTLIDSVPDIAAALNKVLVAEDEAPLSNADVSALVGAGARTLVERAFAPSAVTRNSDAIDALFQDFLRHYEAEPCERTVLYPEALRCLVELKKKGAKLGIVTNKPDALTIQILTDLKLIQLFDAVVGASDLRPLKPNRAMLDYAIKALGCKTANAVFVGDSGADVQAARAAQIPVVLLTHGYMNANPEDLRADAVLAGFDGLSAALADLLPNRIRWQP